jgi:hypothetical protein
MMLSNIVPSKIIGRLKLNVAGDTDVVFSPQMFVKLNQLHELQRWNANITKIVKMRILGMLLPGGKGIEVDSAPCAIKLSQKHYYICIYFSVLFFKFCECYGPDR